MRIFCVGGGGVDSISITQGLNSGAVCQGFRASTVGFPRFRVHATLKRTRKIRSLIPQAYKGWVPVKGFNLSYHNRDLP